MNPDLDPLLTREEVALYLNVTERTVLDWAQRAIIPAIKLSGSWRFRRQDIDLWLETRSSGPDTNGLIGDDDVVRPQPFRSEEREKNIKSCISAIEISMQNSDREEWPAYTFRVTHGTDIANEAIARIVRLKKASLGIKRTGREQYEVIQRRKA